VHIPVFVSLREGRVRKEPTADMLDDIIQPEGTLILQIQNSKKPEQLISVVLEDENGPFETRGLKELFGLQEIRIDRMEFMEWMDEFALVLSFLLETMSAAQDLNLPYGYQDEFEYKGQRYTLFSSDGHRILKRRE
jgi:hypothetical protein